MGCGGFLMSFHDFEYLSWDFHGFSLVHRRYFNVCWPLGLGAFAHFTWSLTKKMMPSCEKYGPSKRKITSWHGVLHSSVKWRSILLSTALWLSFFHFLMPIKCYYVSFKPCKPTVYYIYLLRGELISIVLLGRSNCVPWFHWNVKNGCLSVDSSIRTLPAMDSMPVWPHVFSWNGSCIASWDGLLFFRIFSKTTVVKWCIDIFDI